MLRCSAAFGRAAAACWSYREARASWSAAVFAPEMSASIAAGSVAIAGARGINVTVATNIVARVAFLMVLSSWVAALLHHEVGAATAQKTDELLHHYVRALVSVCERRGDQINSEESRMYKGGSWTR